MAGVCGPPARAAFRAVCHGNGRPPAGQQPKPSGTNQQFNAIEHAAGTTTWCAGGYGERHTLRPEVSLSDVFVTLRAEPETRAKLLISRPCERDPLIITGVIAA